MTDTALDKARRMNYRGVLKEYAPVWESLLRLLDAGVAGVAGWAAATIYLGGLPEGEGYRLGILLGILLVLLMFPSFGLYRAWRGESLGLELRSVVVAWSSVLGVLAVLAFLSKSGTEFSRGWYLIWLLLGGCGLIMQRIFLRALLRELRRRGFNQRRIVIVHIADFGLSLARGLDAAPWIGVRVAALFCARQGACTVGGEVAQPTGPARAFEGLEALAAFVQSEGIDQVWIALPLKEEESIRQVIHELRYSTVDIRYVPDMSDLRLLNSSFSVVAGFPVMNLSSSPVTGANELLKSVFDRLLALVILALISPLMLAIAVGVKLTSPGPVFFCQRRLGVRGEEIEVLKFRSMVVHDESGGHVTQATKEDPRVTPFGAFLRRTSLDELPQFFNVLAGQMSIVGPRPHALEHNEQYKALVQRYMLRHKVKPGITGWAQINGFRGETDTVEKMAKRVEYDLQYIENWSLWLDVKIIALTIVRVFHDRNAY